MIQINKIFILICMKNISLSAPQHIHCQKCSVSDICISFSLDKNELNALDRIIKRKRPIQKGKTIFQHGEKMSSLYAIRTGSFKTFTTNEEGEEQITGFHLAGDLLGFNAIANSEHPSFAQALETSMVCEIPYDALDSLSNALPRLKQQALRMISKEIRSDHNMMSLLNQKSAEQRLATFVSTLSTNYHARGLSSSEFRLPMTRGEIGNYIGLSVETISRLINRLHKNNIIKVDGRLIKIIDREKLKEIASL